MSQNRVEGDLFVTGNVACTTFSPPANSITNASVLAAAGIAAAKLQHQHSLNYTQPNGTAIVAATQGLFICRGATGAMVYVQAMITGVIATGGDRAVTVDVKYGNAATGYTTVLSAAISFTSADALRTVKSGTLAVPAIAAGDSLQIVVAVAGAAGNQAQGLLVTTTVYEDAN